jgi:hypothetical protein
MKNTGEKVTPITSPSEATAAGKKWQVGSLGN